jgi:hypothetical protein
MRQPLARRGRRHRRRVHQSYLLHHGNQLDRSSGFPPRALCQPKQGQREEKNRQVTVGSTSADVTTSFVPRFATTATRPASLQQRLEAMGLLSAIIDLSPGIQASASSACSGPAIKCEPTCVELAGFRDKVKLRTRATS